MLINVFGKEVETTEIKEVDKAIWGSTHRYAEPKEHTTISFVEEEEEVAPGIFSTIGPEAIYFLNKSVEEVKAEINKQITTLK